MCPFELGAVLGITITELELSRSDPAPDDETRHIIAYASLNIPYGAVMSGSFAPSAVVLRGATVYLAERVPDDAESRHSVECAQLCNAADPSC